MTRPWCVLLSDGSARDQIMVAHAIEAGLPAPHVVLTADNPAIEEMAPSSRAATVEAAVVRAAELAPAFATTFSPRHLEAGAVDGLMAAGLRAYGVTRAVGLLENEKTFGKAFLRRAGLPTPGATLSTDADAAKAWIRAHWRGPDRRFVLKNDLFVATPALRVMLPETPDDAAGAVDAMVREAGGRCRIVIEERLPPGVELSLHVLLEGGRHRILPFIQDHKRACDGETGPLTSGMGAVATTAPWRPDLLSRIEREVVAPIVRRLAEEHLAYDAVLYVGLYWAGDGIHVLELNTRPGNPEWIALTRLMTVPMLEVARAGALESRALDTWSVRRDEHYAIAIAALAAGAPERIRESYHERASGLTLGPDAPVLCDHIRREAGDLVVNGGRTVVAHGEGTSLPAARAQAYGAIGRVTYDGMRYRTDIGHADTALVTRFCTPRVPVAADGSGRRHA